MRREPKDDFTKNRLQNLKQDWERLFPVNLVSQEDLAPASTIRERVDPACMHYFEQFAMYYERLRNGDTPKDLAPRVEFHFGQRVELLGETLMLSVEDERQIELANASLCQAVERLTNLQGLAGDALNCGGPLQRVRALHLLFSYVEKISVYLEQPKDGQKMLLKDKVLFINYNNLGSEQELSELLMDVLTSQRLSRIQGMVSLPQTFGVVTPSQELSAQLLKFGNFFFAKQMLDACLVSLFGVKSFRLDVAEEQDDLTTRERRFEVACGLPSLLANLANVLRTVDCLFKLNCATAKLGLKALEIQFESGFKEATASLANGKLLIGFQFRSPDLAKESSELALLTLVKRAVGYKSATKIAGQPANLTRRLRALPTMAHMQRVLHTLVLPSNVLFAKIDFNLY